MTFYRQSITDMKEELNTLIVRNMLRRVGRITRWVKMESGAKNNLHAVFIDKIITLTLMFVQYSGVIYSGF
jgi:hypothetical protein